MGLARWAMATGALALTVSGCGTATAPGQPGAGAATSTVTAVPADCPGGAISGVGPAAQRGTTQEVIGAYADRCNKGSVGYQEKTAEEARQMFGNALSTWLTTEQPLTDAEEQQYAARCAKNPVWHLPTSAAPLAVSWNLPGVEQLTLSPPVLARLLSGAITRWDDPAIKQLNPGINLPAIPVTPVMSGDSPEITTALTTWLASAAGADWPSGPSGEWKGAGIRTETLTDSVSKLLGTPGAMSVLPRPYTRVNSLPGASIDFGAGPVAPTPDAASKALAAFEIPGGNDLRLAPNRGDAAAGAYPLVTIGYQVVCSKGYNTKQAPILRDFLSFWASVPQQRALGDLGLAPLPEPLRGRVATAVGQIQ